MTFAAIGANQRYTSGKGKTMSKPTYDQLLDALHYLWIFVEPIGAYTVTETETPGSDTLRIDRARAVGHAEGILRRAGRIP
jgi:hypothetical protein